ncbi:hypothetical protein CVS47_01747 [Microbacterium lemovicicum]|uniref:ABM domain-containing protein n=1 Tax=Microbacterium lemovicicum TaxID=1072463 RepID=A0A3S9WAP3_9MICO|nr:antibiotic biosynthesis monooxygenase [Microbacterium lemovicicum]AZS37119.1 hypothetical protein CVS47_01747 [Microbacterium lemovicicum]
MSAIRLTGHLICRTAAEADIVARHLARHIHLTRAEEGCLAFAVEATQNPLVWSVSERFADEDVFRLHQARVAVSDWGRATAGIERRYTVTGLTS